MEHEGSYYVLLEATEDMDDCKEGEAIILKIIRDEDSDEDVYATIEDEDGIQRRVRQSAWPPWKKRTPWPTRWSWNPTI